MTVRTDSMTGAGRAVRFAIILLALTILVIGRERLAPWGGTSPDRWIATIFAFLLPVLVGIEMRVQPFSRYSFLRETAATPMARGGIGALLGLYAIAILAPVLAPYAPEAQDLANKSFLAPGADHWFGTDKFGRDLWSRVLYGSRISLTIGFVSVALSVSIGTLVGLLAGYHRGVVDIVLMRFADLLLAFPRLILLLALIALFQPSIYMLVAVLGLTGWMGTARIIRSETLSLREREFVLAAQGFGFGTRRI
ncbi:MAG: ABC transporter permease, partial [Gemmatimonadetes bacterium]|nr:ABC transporter permease [Gemmatimonadota bacterium]